MRILYDAWLSQPEHCHQFTRAGNMKAPSRSLLCEWEKSSWKAVSTEMVKDSFTSCAITVDTDGSQDDKIHCFKAGQPCEGGLSFLKDATRQILQDSMTEQDDKDPLLKLTMRMRLKTMKDV